MVLIAQISRGAYDCVPGNKLLYLE